MNKSNVQVGAAMEYMHVDYRPILKLMLDRENIGEDKLVSDVLQHFTNDRIKSPQEELALTALVGANNRSELNKFGRKLTFQQQCEILGLFLIRGYTRELLAKMYGIDRRTVTHIYNNNSPRYKSVREEVLRLGEANFIAKYVTPEARQNAQAVRAEATEAPNNRQASAKRGIHNMRNDYCTHDHRVLIGWVEAGEQPDIKVSGWYYKDLDSEWPDTWFTAGGVESLKSSQSCYAAALIDISDKLE